MSPVDVLKQLELLAETEPMVADTVLPVIKNVLDFALTSGKVADPDVWIRAFEAATVEVANKKLAKEWLTATRIP